ncbi:MAG: phosphoserine transaminase, partial [Pseudomonadota bacterium]
MSLPTKPQALPARPEFSSGPCPKRPGYDIARVAALAHLGRSHRAAQPKAQIKEVIDLTARLLGVPEGYKVGIVPASDTGAYEMAMWSMLGARPVDMLVWESFGAGWATDATKQLRLDDCRVLKAGYGELPPLEEARADADICFTWNGTTSGARVPNADWIADDRQGLTFCDATSAAFAQDLPWDKLDVTTFSWQKVMGGEAAHGVLILSPRAVERLESYTPDRPLPKIFRLTKGGKLIDGIFTGATINTPSMLAVADALDALQWIEGIGG